MKFLRHVFYSLFGIRPIFSAADLRQVDSAVGASEKRHACQICVAIEGSMPLWSFVRGRTSRERAWEIFSLERLWDTENNVGILIFISLAEREVEIVADRAVASVIDEEALEQHCKILERHFKGKQFTLGITELLLALDAELSVSFPARPGKDEIAKRVAIY